MTEIATDRVTRELVELARAQGWRVDARGDNRLAWYPAGNGAVIFTAARLGAHNGHIAQDARSELRRGGLRLAEEKPARAEAPPEPVTPFVRDLAGLIEQEIDRRNRNLQDQVTALQNENQDLRQRLADAEGDVERRATEAAMEAVKAVLAQRRRV